MKIINVFSILIFPAVLASQTINIHNNRLVYKLNKSWNISLKDSTEGIKRTVYKRNPITDSNNIDVIPNIQIIVFKMLSDNNKQYQQNDDIEPFDLMTKIALMNFAPLVALKEYKESKLKPIIKYQMNYKPSYGFLSEYVDNFNESHDCYYFTIMKEEQIGALIMIDSTKEIFPFIDKEVIEFLSSISVK